MSNLSPSANLDTNKEDTNNSSASAAKAADDYTAGMNNDDSGMSSVTLAAPVATSASYEASPSAISTAPATLSGSAGATNSGSANGDAPGEDEHENTMNRHMDGERETKRHRSSSTTEDDLGEESSHDDSEVEERGDRSPNARGYPINLNDSSDEEEDIDFVFGESQPSSMEELAAFITSDKCQNIVVLAGAGMSVRSGIPDFRSSNGLYATMNPDLLTADPGEREAIRMDPSAALEQGLFLRNPLPCLELNRSFLLGTRDQRWKATLAHRFVEMLHTKTNKLVRLYTQNIDGLEDQCTELPRDKVINVHGSMDRAACATCFQESDFDSFCDKVERQIKDLSGEDASAPDESTPIVCEFCGFNTMKPAIVLFKSSLPKRFFELLPGDVADVDLLIVIGTSLQVAPANGLVWLVPRSALRLVINRDPVGHHLGIQYGLGARRDYFAQGDIDPTCLDLMTHLGWLDELEPLLTENKLPDSSAELLKERLQQLAASRTAATDTD
jgi:NAD+-dependent protein deacetylase sirtuin 2